MPEPDGYKDWTGLAQAIKAAATKAAGDGASALDVNAQIVQAQHDRRRAIALINMMDPEAATFTRVDLGVMGLKGIVR